MVSLKDMASQNDDPKTTKSADLAPKESSEILLEKTENEDDFLEEETDFFWIFQRIFWGFIKAVAFLGVIIFVVWLIWSDEKPSSSPLPTTRQNTQNQNPPTPIRSEATNLETQKIDPQNTQATNESMISSHFIKDVARLTQQIGMPDQNETHQNLLTQSIQWLKKTKILGQVDPEILRLQAPALRAQKIESVLREADALLAESQVLQKKLAAELQTLKKQMDFQTQIVETQTQSLSEKIQNFETEDIQETLQKKIEARKSQAQYAEEGAIREKLLKNIQNFDRLIRQKWIPLVSPTQWQGQTESAL
jgi:hypothetical protein